jgi:hypothetical protein
VKIKWINIEKSRFFQASLAPNPLGGMLLIYKWGSTKSNSRGRMKFPVRNMLEVDRKVSELKKKRAGGGYQMASHGGVYFP